MVTAMERVRLRSPFTPAVLITESADEQAKIWEALEQGSLEPKRALMTTLVRKARGRPFKLGNPGRPPGSKNKIIHFGVKEVYPR